MQNVVADIWPYVLTALISVFGTYFAAVHKLKERVAVLELKAENLQKRVDSHSTKYDDILKGVMEIKESIAMINATLSIINKETGK